MLSQVTPPPGLPLPHPPPEDVLLGISNPLATTVDDPIAVATAFRLMHCMCLHPIICLIGGWTSLPMLSLIANVFGSEDFTFLAEKDEAMQSEQILRAIQFPKHYERGTKSVHLLRSTPSVLLVGEENVCPHVLGNVLHAARRDFFSVHPSPATHASLTPLKSVHLQF